MTVRQFLVVTHRWIGLTCAAVLLVAGLTGSLLMLPQLARSPFLVELHTHLAAGAPGRWLVNLATVAGSLLVLGGVILWFRSKLIKVNLRKGWRRFLHDLHHSAGLIFAVVMLVIAVTGTGLMLTQNIDPRPPRPGVEAKNTPFERNLRRTVRRLHSGLGMGAGVAVVYFVGSGLFALQGVSGLTMWLKRQPRRRPRNPPNGEGDSSRS